MTKYLNISTDTTLGGLSPSDEVVSSQKAIKDYVDGKIPTVNNPTITITQGGVTKGSFTLNQASGDTIALDAGGGGGGLNPGFVAPFAGTTAPDGWLVCDGSAISRTTYANLFAAIGTTYGPGNGTTTFNVPNISDCFVQGGTPGTTHNASLPNITGSFGAVGTGSTAAATGCFAKTQSGGKIQAYSNGYEQNISFDANRSSSIYDSSTTTVQPKSVEMSYCIKY